MNAWTVAENILREGTSDSQLQQNLQKFKSKMEEAKSAKNQLYMSLEKSITANPKFEGNNDAWKFIYDFREAGLGIEEAMTEYEKIVNDFQKFSHKNNEEMEQEKTDRGAFRR